MDDACYVADRSSIKGNSVRRSRRKEGTDSLPRRLLLLLILALVCRMATALDPASRHVTDTSRHICSKKSAINVFYNESVRHHVMEREARDEEAAVQLGRSREREIKKIKTRDDEEEEEEIDIDPDHQQPQQPEPPQRPPASSPSSATGGSSSASGCGACRPREELRKESLETIKREILSKLGMTQPPNLTGRFRPEFGVHYLLAKYESDTRGGSKNQYPLRRHAHSHSHHNNGLHWVTPDDESVQMQGDAPSDSNGGGRGNSKDYGEKSNQVRSQMNSSDSRYSESLPFQEGEVYSEEDDDYHVRTKKVVAFSLPHPKLRHIQPDIQFFQFSDKARTNKVKRAVLWVYIRGTDAQDPHLPMVSGTHFNITIYKLHKSPQARSNDSPIILPVVGRLTQLIPRGHGSWMNLEFAELEKLVGEWFRTPQQNMGLIINATDRQGTNLAATSQQANNMSAVPFLEVYLTDSKKHRTKRTLGINCNDSSDETRCCRYPLTVDFEEFGWDWIIAPKKYEANFCDGDCPFSFMQQYAHTHLAQLSTTPRARSGPCCAPRKLSAISMLYFDSNMNIMFGTLPAMVVDRCGCM